MYCHDLRIIIFTVRRHSPRNDKNPKEPSRPWRNRQPKLGSDISAETAIFACQLQHYLSPPFMVLQESISSSVNVEKLSTGADIREGAWGRFWTAPLTLPPQSICPPLSFRHTEPTVTVSISIASLTLLKQTSRWTAETHALILPLSAGLLNKAPLWWSKEQKIIFMHLPVPETVGNVCFCRTETHSAWSEVRMTENKTGTRPILRGKHIREYEWQSQKSRERMSRRQRYFVGRRVVYKRWQGGRRRSVWLNLRLTFRTGEIDEVPLRFTLCGERRERNRNSQCGEPGLGALSHRGVPGLINGAGVPSKTALPAERAAPRSKNNQDGTDAPLRTVALRPNPEPFRTNRFCFNTILPMLIALHIKRQVTLSLTWNIIICKLHRNGCRNFKPKPNAWHGVG